jgi:hypothetical protein
VDVLVEVVVDVGEVLASLVPSSVLPPHATPATTSVAPPKTIAARVAREMGWGTAVLWTLLQKGHVVSVVRTWRAHEAQSFNDMRSSVHSNGVCVQSKVTSGAFYRASRTLLGVMKVRTTSSQVAQALGLGGRA